MYVACNELNTSFALQLCNCLPDSGDCFPSSCLETMIFLKLGVCIPFCRWLCWTKSVLLLCRHIIKIIGVRAEIKITQNQVCVLKSMYCCSNDCMQWVYVSISPSYYSHCSRCLMDYHLSTTCCKTVRNTSLYKFEFNCFLCWWSYFILFLREEGLERVW